MSVLPEKYVIVLGDGLYVDTVWIEKGSVVEYDITPFLADARVCRSDNENDTNEIRGLLNFSSYLEVREYNGESK